MNQIHLGVYPHNCPKKGCDWPGATTKDKLEQHMWSVHHEGAGVECPNCDTVLSSSAMLRKHLKNVCRGMYISVGCRDSSGRRDGGLDGRRDKVCNRYVVFFPRRQPKEFIRQEGS